jgi:hypothetical protein
MAAAPDLARYGAGKKRRSWATAPSRQESEMGLTWRHKAVVFAVIGLVASSCGEDDRLTVEAFVEQANAICEAGNERVDAIFEAATPEDFEDEAKVAEFKTTLEADIEGQIDSIRELEPPEDLEADVEQFVDDADVALGELREMSPQEFFESEGGGDVFADVSRQADEIGIGACADDDGDGEEEGQGEEAAAPDHTVVDVTATEYSFALASPTLTAGPNALHLINGGQEDHELSFARIGEGHTLQEALEFEGDPEAAGLIVDPSGDSGAIGPGEDIFLNVDLEPGTYGLVCFVEAADGTPHAFKGMVVEFEVA